MSRVRPEGRLITALVLIAASLLAAEVTAAPKAWTVSIDRVGPLRFGMSLSDSYKALGVTQPVDMISASATDSCVELAIPDQTDAVMMFENNRLSRVVFYGDSKLKTSLGIGIGATESEVMAKYPAAEAAPRQGYAPPASDLTQWNKKNISGIRFKTNESREVDAVLIGGQSITYSGGCA